MKNINQAIENMVFWLFAVSIIQITFLSEANAQYPGIDESIAKHRKGELIIKAKPGDKVIVEQLSHEFWFGCAISNSLAGNFMSENDLRQYKEKFLENFNSAVTENAVKWYSMEPRKDNVNYAMWMEFLNGLRKTISLSEGTTFSGGSQSLCSRG